MRCKHFTIRSKKYERYYFCRYDKKVITIDECKNCLNRILIKNKPMKKRSDKLSKIERARYSIFTDDMSRCWKCKKTKKQIKIDPHEVYGGSNRLRSIKNGFVVPLCRDCHGREEVIAEIRIQCEEIYERDHSIDDFIRIIGKRYIIGG